MVIRGQVTEKKLEQIYDIARAIIKDNSCYYTQEEIDELKKDSKNIFFKGGGTSGRN